LSQRYERAEADAFEQADQSRQASLLGEFVSFLKHNKKYWLVPLLLALLGLGVLILLGGTAAAPSSIPCSSALRLSVQNSVFNSQ